MSSPYVLFEGLDLAGKSTAARNFARRAPHGPWHIREKSLTDTNPIRTTAVDLKKDERFTDTTMGWLHFASFLADLDTFEPPSEPTVQESLTIFRSIAFHSVLGDTDLSNAFKKHLSSIDMFSSAFLLTASLEARQERLAKRIESSPANVSFLDRLVVDEPSSFVEMEKRLFDAMHVALGEFVVVDTVELPQESVTSLAIRAVFGQPSLFDQQRYYESNTHLITDQGYQYAAA